MASYQQGAPLFRCESMQPGHGFQGEGNPYQLTVRQNGYTSGGRVEGEFVAKLHCLPKKPLHSMKIDDISDIVDISWSAGIKFSRISNERVNCLLGWFKNCILMMNTVACV